MKVLNIHQRTISQPLSVVATLIDTLSSKEDMIWPKEKWPSMRLKEGLKIGSKGGHGPIRYWVKHYEPGKKIDFEFTKPSGFKGVHTLELKEISSQKTGIKHTIEMKTNGLATFTWVFAIRWLHDALMEDAFDKVENHFSPNTSHSRWNLWVKLLRFLLKPKK